MALSDKQVEYREVYLRSDHWRRMRQLALEDAEYRCAVCNSSKGLDVHHRTYERLGNERLTDLLVLCRKCHELFHQSGRLAGSSAPSKPKQRKGKRKGKGKHLRTRPPGTPQPSPGLVRSWIEKEAAEQLKAQRRQVRNGEATPTTKAGLANRYRA